MVKQARAGVSGVGVGAGVGTASDDGMGILQEVPRQSCERGEAPPGAAESSEIRSSNAETGNSETDDTKSARRNPKTAASSGSSRRSRTAAGIKGAGIKGAGIKGAGIKGVRIAGDKIAGGKNRVVQMRKPRAREWTETIQKAFLDQLALTGNVTTSVAVVDMSVGGAYNRRAHDPAFAAGWQAALLRGYERLEELLLATTLAALDRSGVGSGGAEGCGDEGGGIEGGGVEGGVVQGGGVQGVVVEGGGVGQADRDRSDDGASDDAGREPAGRQFRIAAKAGGPNTGQAVPGAGLIQLSSVTAIQFALAMLNQHRADQVRGRKRNQIHRATSAETDAVLTKLLDSLARRRARES